MSPVDDTFISGSLDKTIRLWDLRSPNCQVSHILAVYLCFCCCRIFCLGFISLELDLTAVLSQGLMHLQGKPVCSFDPEGLIFAAGVNSEMVKLYDLRSFDKVRETSVKFTFWNFDKSC